MLRISVMLLIALFAANSAHAERRLAFVVGVNSYDNLAPDKQLQKAVGDAKALGATLTELGFVVAVHENPRRADFNRAWQAFLNSAQPGDQIAVFFSGHGVQVGGLNYLMPRDVPKISRNEEDLLREEAISLQRLLDNAKARSPRLLLMIIDACRDNPFPAQGGKSVGGAERGLARVDPPSGAFIMLSAGAGQTALDRLPGNDPEPTSVFTRHLLPLLRQPGLPLQQVALRVRNDVSVAAARISHVQTPAYWDELTGAPVCLNGACRDLAVTSAVPAPTPAPSAPAPTESAAAREWKAVDKSNSAELATFVRRHKGSPEADYAAARLESIPKSVPPQQTAATPSASSPTGRTTAMPRFEFRGLSGAVKQAAKSSTQVSIVVELANKTGQGIALAAAAEPDGHGLLISGEGTTCKVRRVLGLGELWETDLSMANVTGNRRSLDQNLTRIGPGETITATFAVAPSDCEGTMRITTGRLNAQFYVSRDGRIEKSGLSVGPMEFTGQ